MLLIAACFFNLFVEKASAADVLSTNVSSKVQAPKPPGPKYTHSIGMLLPQVPGNMWAGKYEVTQKEFQESDALQPKRFRQWDTTGGQCDLE